MSKITLNNVADLTSTTTAESVINTNSSTIQTAFDNTLSRDGTSPNPMLSTLDMNSNAIINLPAPATANSPLRLQDASTLNGGGTISSLPTGGVTGSILSKNSATNFDTGWSAPGTIFRERLSTDRTYFVSTTGNNNNDGLTVGTPFLTIGKAVSIIGQNLDINGHNVTVQLADGTYNETVSLIPYIGRISQGHIAPTAVVIQGNAVTPANVVVNGSFQAIEAGYYEWIIRNLKIIGGSNNAIYADVGGWLVVDNVVFGTTTANHMLASFGVVEVVTNYTISGNAANHILATNPGNFLYVSGLTITLTGTPVFSGAFINITAGGYALVPVGTTFSGAATGTRWVMDATAVLAGVAGDTATLNATFPGNANGVYTALTVVRGGTGVLTSTGSGNNVLSTSPTFVT
ncbi:MAG TPA: hypothetical protein VEP90_08015, partial [Methylomirabilota bacterium]|nr:hypothetical protein [Methylomirabilota bacterium]